MNISCSKQRVLHVLAQGGYIRHQRADNGRIIDVLCFTRDGHVLADCTPEVFAKLRRKRLIESRASSPIGFPIRVAAPFALNSTIAKEITTC